MNLGWGLSRSLEWGLEDQTDIWSLREALGLPTTGENISTPLLRTRGFSGDTADLATPAGCRPELAVVHIGLETSSFFFPGCTRMERCSGCCSHPLLACRPTRTEVPGMNIAVAVGNGLR